MSDATRSQAVRGLKLDGKDLDVALDESVTRIQLDWSTTEVSQVTVEVSDPDFKLLKNRVLRRNAALEYRGLPFRVAIVEIVGNQSIQLVARSLGAQRMKSNRAEIAASGSPTAFVRSLAKRNGLEFVGQETSAKATVSKESNVDDERESDWDTAQRIAGEVGFIAYEIGGVLFFGKPTWLIGREKTFTFRWPRAGGGEYTPYGNVPRMRTSEDAKDGASGTFDMAWEEALEGKRAMRPGRKVTLAGLGGLFNGDYMVTKMSIELGAARPATLSIATPVDPEPRPPQPDVDDTSLYQLPSFESLFGTTTGSVSSQASGSEGFIWPCGGRLSSGFGPRWGRMHKGLDIAAPAGEPIYASRAGTVSYAGWANGYGNVVYIDHGGGVQTRYAHMSRIETFKTANVARGQLIGRVGTTGRSTGNHLHFEIRISGSAKDPRPYLPGGASPSATTSISSAQALTDPVAHHQQEASGAVADGEPPVNTIGSHNSQFFK